MEHRFILPSVVRIFGEHLREQFSGSTASVDLPSMPPRETMSADVSSSELQAIREMEFRKKTESWWTRRADLQAF